jgi:predicted Zn-ribbon and HTH transcriptional regulator
MGYPRVTAEEWSRRALAVNSEWLEIPKTSNARAKLLCLVCAHTWVATGANIKNKQGCPKCAKNAPISDDEWALRADKIGAKWLELPTKATDKKPIVCKKCGFSWKAFAYNVYSGYGCHACAGREKVSSEEWDFRALKVNAKWLELPAGRAGKGKLQCIKCLHVWQASGKSISSGSGCPACANHGYSPAKPGTLYVLDFENGSIGYGISNVPADRLRTHSRRIFFRQHRLWNFTDGRLPEKLETAIKRQYAPTFHVDLKIDGFRTEAIGNWPFAEFCKFVDMLIEGEVTHA